ncbi:hypothetical protein, partial [Paenibacillus antibioticophila]|uniref:hypothetical protein n=1 Tax=Paenibacillus antibioticophila TaxID=1274374 RepID=UPI001BB4199C
ERVEKFTFSLSGTLLTFWNRRMRTRMYGGVRGRGLAAPSYSIVWLNWMTIKRVKQIPSLISPDVFLFSQSYFVVALSTKLH